RVGRRGLGTAIVEGLRAARGRFVAVMDADLQHPPEVLPRLLEAALRGYDVVVASRYAPGGGVAGWSRRRLLMSRAAVLLAHLLLPESRATSDPMSGFWLVRREALEGVELEGRSWKVLLELLAKKPRLRVADVAYTFEPRVHGESKLGASTVAGYVAELLRLSRYRVLRFALVGATGTLVNAAVAEALSSAGAPGPLALALGWEAGLTWNFILHDRWTFRGRRSLPGLRGALRYWLRYHLAAGLGFTLYMAAGSLLLALGAAPWQAVLGGVAAGFTANYLASEHRVWSPRERG
ncbi:MAG: glycosyltransferase, partial [Crenarchaeota archaeon]|nr:glycosyltransferase [Thermoproteota archaeon]